MRHRRPRARMSRRQLVQRALVLAGGAALLPAARMARAQGVQVTASGSGVNVKMMPDPDGNPSVPLRESFAFDPAYAQCIVEDNPARFAMDTFAMGRVVIEPHTFFMAMHATEVALVEVTGTPDGPRRARLVGSLDCATEATTATTTVGSRTATEPALFEILAVDGGHGGGAAGDRFEFTVYFDPDRAPVNHAVFGPKATFTGDMVRGEVTIGPPVLLPLA